MSAPRARQRLRQAAARHLAGLAVARGCGRLEWWVLDWNQGAIDFYLSLGAEPMSDWTVYRLSGDALTRLALRPLKAARSFRDRAALREQRGRGLEL